MTDVQSEALRRFARAAEESMGRMEKIRSRTQDLDLSQGVFGKLPEADSLKSDYDEQRNDSLDDLKQAAEMLQHIADGVKESADAYDGTDEATAQSFGGGR
ncbi:hypothetical protein AB0D04_08260 [Streptomyces sp. NPDC048483]|uniref:hypothetical protein n=1 Tax=Streptomyces sp. NPDC048483 TaxID=3154927 RepID=UPI0034477C57